MLGNKACELLQKEIERASKAPQGDISNVGKQTMIKDNPLEPTESSDIDKVINILSSKKSGLQGPNTAINPDQNI